MQDCFMTRKPTKDIVPIMSDKKPLLSKDAGDAPEPPAIRAPAQGAERIMKPAVILVGADKGGVGKTTVARAVLDYLGANNIMSRAFDTEYPRGALHRFHPHETSIVDLTSTSDQMRILDTLSTAQIKVSVVDVRAGGMMLAMQALEETGFLDAVNAGEFDFLIFHVLGPSIASLEEIEEIAPYVEGGHYFLVKNHINDTTFFEWDPLTHRRYFEKVETAGEITIPKLDEMAYEQVEIAGTPFSTFVGDRTAEGDPAGHSFTLRGKVRTWLIKIADEFDRVSLLNILAPRSVRTSGRSR
jgi:hypothetical protein